MGISDIITLLSLVIAIVAIVSEKNRSHILLKFRPGDVALIVATFLFINYFSFYPDFYVKGWYVRWLYFDSFGLGNPRHYAYIITLLLLGYFFYKLQFAFFPASRLSKVKDYYRRLTQNNEVSFLIDLLERYHKKDIIRMIESEDDFNTNERPLRPDLESKTRWQKFRQWGGNCMAALFPSGWQNRESYARMVLWNIINDPAFLALGARLRPYFFADIFHAFKKVKQDAFPTDLVNTFLAELLAHRDFWLKKELKESTNNTPNQQEWFFRENKILGSLWSDLSVADVNQIWQPFGEAAIEEIKTERAKGTESILYHEYTGDNQLWELTTWQAIQFFYATVNLGIVRNYKDSHFFLSYYDYIINAIVKNLDRHPPENEQGKNLLYQKLIDEMMKRSFHWLENANSYDDSWIYHNILMSIGNNINTIMKCPHIDEEKKIGLLDTMLRYYCNVKDNKHSEELRKKYEEMMRKPSMLTTKREDDPYYAYFAHAWKAFDKIPHGKHSSHGVEYTYFRQLKDNVIIQLGFDPEEY